jgi:hypothetical protein
LDNFYYNSQCEWKEKSAEEIYSDFDELGYAAVELIENIQYATTIELPRLFLDTLLGR